LELEIFKDLEDMEVDISKQIPNWATMQLVESQALVEELAREGLVVFEDDTITLHHASYQKDSRKLSLQHVSFKGKHITKKWRLEIERKNANPSDVMELHRATSEALEHTMDDQER